jgi:hypothetical protein
VVRDGLHDLLELGILYEAVEQAALLRCSHVLSRLCQTNGCHLKAPALISVGAQASRGTRGVLEWYSRGTRRTGIGSSSPIDALCSQHGAVRMARRGPRLSESVHRGHNVSAANRMAARLCRAKARHTPVRSGGCSGNERLRLRSIECADQSAQLNQRLAVWGVRPTLSLRCSGQPKPHLLQPFDQRLLRVGAARP